MGRSSTYPLVDRILDGRLADLLTDWRAEGATFQDIAYRLRSEHDIKVSIATVQRWWETIPVCDCAEPDTDRIGMCRTCKRKPLALLRRPAEEAS